MDDGDDAVTGTDSGSYAPENLCYAGERVVERAPLGGGWAAVTTHRVLAYDPSANGRRFEAIDRPNVRAVSVDAEGDQQLLGWALRAGVYGLVGVGGGVVLRAMNLGETLAVGASAGSAPIGGVLAVVDALAAALALLTTLLLVGGVALCVGGVALGWRYLRTRQPALVVERFGESDVRFGAPRADGRHAAQTLAAALDDRGGQ
ncbi:hypothetical protein SAMN04488065_0025 [Haloplanus vescus]|uniref:Uncharacterized protein n=1 Tax=Haloplanus vescus TaxID=555874 RepID=A0A1H3VJU9_9EURY|nr:hypothetical protein [Haloplanus vescus]SDZ75050.1 hypothetical protein SAMN04488065_0025 [Haloplanus vescus]